MPTRLTPTWDRLLRGWLGCARAPSRREWQTVHAVRQLADQLRSSKARTSLVAWCVVALVLIAGTRELILHNVPAVGDLPVFGDSPTALVRAWLSGYRDVGLGAVEPAPTGLGFIGLAGYLVLGSMGLLRMVLILGTLPVGLIGMWRLVKPVGSRRSRIVALVVYAAVPVPFNALAGGRWGGLVMYALSPWIISQLAATTRVAPWGPLGGEPGPGVRDRPLFQRMVAVGVLTALAALLSPAAIALVPLIALALVVGGLLAGQTAGALRMLYVGIGGAVVAFVLHLPWSRTFISSDWAAIAGTSSAGGRPLGLGHIVRLQTGPLGSGVLGVMFLVAAALPLFIGRQWRVSWAVRGWAIALAGLAGVWVASRGWLPGEIPAPEMLLAPAAAGLALATAMGMAAFEVDLPDYHFGWRQILSLVAGVALVLGVVPVLGAVLDGRWETPRGDYNRTLAFLDKEAEAAPFRVLWLGDAGVLPVAGWHLDAPQIDDLGRGSTLTYATSDNGTPNLEDRWAGSPSAATTRLADALQVAAAGGTSRLGGLLAPMGVRYVVVPLGPAPAPYTKEPSSTPAATVDMLDGQLDLSTIDVNVGVVVYRNDAWGPTRALLPAGTVLPSGGPALADRFVPELQGAPAALPDAEGYVGATGPIDKPSLVYLSAAAADGWHLEVDGAEVPRSEALGWANSFEVDTTGSATLSFDTSLLRPLLLLGQMALWVVALVYLLRVRVTRDERRTLPPAEHAQDETAGVGS